MKKIVGRDISELKEFTKYGDTFKQIRNNPETGWWLYERETHYEVVKGKRYINPTGEVVYLYPSDCDWGNLGYTIPKCWWAEKVIEFLMGRKTTSAQELYEFKKTLRNPVSSPKEREIRQF